MAKLTYKFHNKYSFDAYDDVIKTYAWLRGCFEYVFSNIKNLEISESFNFSAQMIDYECHSVSEFKEHAFGHDIKPEIFFLCARDNSGLWDNTLAHFWARKNPEQIELEIVLTSDNKSTIVAIKDYLLLSEAQINQLPPLRRSEVFVDVDKHRGENTTKENSDPVEIKLMTNTETWHTKLIWKIIIPITVAVIAAVIIWLLDIR